jgi:class I fructose-bisphosphate aldolase
MQIGKSIRNERIFNRDTGRTIIVPLDHGVSVGPIKGLQNMRDTVTGIGRGGANACSCKRAWWPCGHRAKGRDIGLIVHLSASTSLSPIPNAKTLVCTVEESHPLGPTRVTHVNLGDETESRMLEDLGRITHSAASWGMPMLAMIMPGPKIKNEFDPEVVATAPGGHGTRRPTWSRCPIWRQGFLRRVCEGCAAPWSLPAARSQTTGNS